MVAIQNKTLRVVAMSDTHLRHNFVVPDGDILIHAGDGCAGGDLIELAKWVGWLSTFPHKYKIAIAGNHDVALEKQPNTARAAFDGSGVDYLQDSEVTIEGLRIYGAPWQPAFCDWAFNLPRGEVIRRKWMKIPTGIDILVTHGPPALILDQVMYHRVGCGDLREEVLGRIKPRYHIFGHIHYSYGIEKVGDTVFMNAAICGESYQPDNAPHVFDIEVNE